MTFFRAGYPNLEKQIDFFAIPKSKLFFSFMLASQNQSTTQQEQFCNFTVQKPLPSICQLNLKFNDFRFAEKEGTCKEGLAVSSYVFCGNLTGRDFDIEFSGDSLEMSFFSPTQSRFFQF